MPCRFISSALTALTVTVKRTTSRTSFISSAFHLEYSLRERSSKCCFEQNGRPRPGFSQGLVVQPDQAFHFSRTQSADLRSNRLALCRIQRGKVRRSAASPLVRLKKNKQTRAAETHTRYSLTPRA